MKIDGLNLLIIGTGISGIAAADLAAPLAGSIVLYDSNPKTDPKEVTAKLRSREGIRIIVGELPETVMDETDLLILSPGVPTDLDLVLKMQEKKIPVWGEIELAYAFSKGRIVGITGTNGKTTTTALTGEIMSQFYKSVFVVGNIGIPYTRLVENTVDTSITVAELSSFQLETIKRFRPDVSMILNITPDHLNRHHTMENYIDAKFNITMNQSGSDVCVLNYEDEVLRKRAGNLNCKVLFFSSERELKEGLYLKGDMITASLNGEVTEIIDVNELNIIGKHNHENAMAAIAAALSLNVPVECIRAGLRNFKAVEHRIEFVCEKNGVKYYNDSKGTNPDAAIKAIQAMKSKTCLIGGGYDKGNDFKEWINAFDGKVKKLVLIGQTKEFIAKQAMECGFNDFVFAGDLKEAVKICADEAKAGECVLLSPACASWGMFTNYEERGRIFKELVNAL